MPTDSICCRLCGRNELAHNRRICGTCVALEQRKYRPKRLCVICGAGPIVGQGKHMYCSDDCKLITRTCRGCGDEFRVERKRKDRNFFCSKRCVPSSNPKIARVDKPCGHCGETMKLLPSQAHITKFCSRSCAALARPINGKPSKIADAAIDEFLKGTPLLCELEKRLGRWSVDMALPLHSIAVELDGAYWHSLPAMVEKDQRKDAWLSANGWTVIRIVMDRHDTPQSIARRIAEELDACLMSAPAA